MVFSIYYGYLCRLYIDIEMERVKCLIVGGGPAGYTAAIYTSRAGLSPVLYEGMEPGGQLTTTTVVENFPGFPQGVDANTLMADMRSQALRFGADIRSGTVTKADLSSRPFSLTIDGETVVSAETVIVVLLFLSELIPAILHDSLHCRFYQAQI